MLPRALVNFSWVIDGALCGLAQPGRVRPLAHDLEDLAERGVTLLVTALPSPMPRAVLEASPLEGLHVPIRDFGAPTPAQVDLVVDRARAEIDGGGAVAVHCFAGMGRTGTLLAAYLVATTGIDGRRAIKRIRELRPGSIETADQERAVIDLGVRLGR